MEKYSKGCLDFINDSKIEELVLKTKEDKTRTRDILAKSLSKEPLSQEECAGLIASNDEELVEEIKETARKLKREVYGNRIVIFAPLYIGNHCINDCEYCAFRRSLRTTVRKTLTSGELITEVEALEKNGHKRLVLVFGEHPDYSPEFIADTVRKVYSIKTGHGEIRRVNINAAPMSIEGFKTVKNSGIGTYQIFQETYHHKTYGKMHPQNTCKGDYLYRLDGLSRAFEAGCDDMGVGALFGLYDWRFEVLALIKHSLYLQKRYGVGPHTISFPRIQPAHGVNLDSRYFVSDKDFLKLIAILRLSVPYTGLILTARESAKIRNEALGFGVSQIDAGSCIELGGYSKGKEIEDGNKEQFSLSDTRSLDQIIKELIKTGYIPSFCTSCYRLGRTGKHFMEYAIPGFIGNFCTPNALLTLKEYLLDYASPETKKAGVALIEEELKKITDPSRNKIVSDKLRLIDENKRDQLFQEAFMRLTNYGIREWLGSGIIAIILILVLLLLYAKLGIDFLIYVASFVFICWGAIAAFFRDPYRKIPSKDSVLVSPADGTVQDITVLKVPEYREIFGDIEFLRIGIFLSVFNVHLNRAPCDLIVRCILYKKGKFYDARNKRAIKDNESNTLLCKGKISGFEFPMAVKQISGAIAKRIVCLAKCNDFLKKGDKFGMIKFGSRTEIYLPKDETIIIKLSIGDKVKAGKSIIAEIKNKAK